MREAPHDIVETWEKIGAMREAELMAEYEARVERIVSEWERQKTRSGGFVDKVIDVRAAQE